MTPEERIYSYLKIMEVRKTDISDKEITDCLKLMMLYFFLILRQMELQRL